MEVKTEAIKEEGGLRQQRHSCSAGRGPRLQGQGQGVLEICWRAVLRDAAAGEGDGAQLLCPHAQGQYQDAGQGQALLVAA